MFIYLTSLITRRLFKGWNEKVQLRFLVYFVFSFFVHHDSPLSVAYIQYYNITIKNKCRTQGILNLRVNFNKK